NTNVELAWDEPLERNGIIRKYRVEYFHVESQACPPGRSVERKQNEVDVTEKSIKIDSLAPYSKYRINVWAITTQIGIGEKFEFKTMQTEKPTEREFPAASFTESTESLFVQFQWNCTILEGSVNFDANLACKSSWCFNETARKSSTSFTQPKDSFTFGTIGYTDYELTMFISRNSNQISKTIPFRTPPTA
ncbi:Fibronectin domain-containing protein, partial [Oryctes borbonicus]